MVVVVCRWSKISGIFHSGNSSCEEKEYARANNGVSLNAISLERAKEKGLARV